MDLLLTVAMIVLVLLVGAAAAYNGLAFLRQDVRDAWGAMDQQLRRRYEMLPPLVAVVRATGEPYPPALSAALTAKNQAAVAFNPQQLATAEAALSAHLRDLFDQPPASLANDPGFARSRSDLSAAATAIGQAGRRHNDAVAAYNAALESFPHDVAAVAFGFKPQPTFEPAAAT